MRRTFSGTPLAPESLDRLQALYSRVCVELAVKPQNAKARDAIAIAILHRIERGESDEEQIVLFARDAARLFTA